MNLVTLVNTKQKPQPVNVFVGYDYANKYPYFETFALRLRRLRILYNACAPHYSERKRDFSFNGSVWTLLAHFLDYFTKWIEAIRLLTQDAASVTIIIFNEWIRRFGAPLSLHSECGAYFDILDEGEPMEEKTEPVEVTPTDESP
ncbi:unnamed protein product [Dibothriocephalus latus]|uniref:Integrase catalytic domain-containing protein n=1 Tax=Dibothriocephalus latus TaxID=60516 RepID=A0A3P7N547_DIBLA|nr:unnamed protein product [Dibothriocephalus latus]